MSNSPLDIPQFSESDASDDGSHPGCDNAYPFLESNQSNSAVSLLLPSSHPSEAFSVPPNIPVPDEQCSVSSTTTRTPCTSTSSVPFRSNGRPDDAAIHSSQIFPCTPSPTRASQHSVSAASEVPSGQDVFPSAHSYHFRACRLRRLYSPTALLNSDESSVEKQGLSSSESENEKYSSSSMSSSALESSDDEDSDWGAPKRRSSRCANGRLTQRKANVSKPCVASHRRPAAGTDDSDHDSLSWPKVRPVQRLMKAKRRRRKDWDLVTSDDDDYGIADASDTSAQSLSSRRRDRSRKRHRRDVVDTAAAPSRVSARRAAQQKSNYLHYLEESESEQESCSSATDVVDSGVSEAVRGVDKVLGYRLLCDADDVEPSVVPLSLKKDGTEPGIHEVQFFVKWLRTSHLHNTWCTYNELQQEGVSGLRKVENFYKKLNTLRQDRLHMTEDEIEQQNIALELQKQIYLDCLIAERIFAHRVDEVDTSAVKANECALVVSSLTKDLPLMQQENPVSGDTLLPGSASPSWRDNVRLPGDTSSLAETLEHANFCQKQQDSFDAAFPKTVPDLTSLGEEKTLVSSGIVSPETRKTLPQGHIKLEPSMIAQQEGNASRIFTPDSSPRCSHRSSMEANEQPDAERFFVTTLMEESSKVKSTRDTNDSVVDGPTAEPSNSVKEEQTLKNNQTCTSGGIRRVDMYLVKWTNASYDQSTWESQETLEAHNFKLLIDAFWERESRICGDASAYHPLHNHALSRTSFEPYQDIPFYMSCPKNGGLRDYQLTGINWMISRMKKGLSVLLADEMGLGKTVQTISVIGHLLFAELIAGPCLVVVPQSTADNWLSEFRQWLPMANVVVYHGNPMSRAIIREYELGRLRVLPYALKRTNPAAVAVGHRVLPTSPRRIRYRFDVCICTFSVLNNAEDLNILRSVDWYFLAIDEAHLLKNRESRRFRELNWFKTRYRLLLSGTPLHNNLEELWSLLHFLCPRNYEDFDTFKERFSEIERTDSVGDLKEKQLAILQGELHEMVLRRVKKDVEKSLPKKIERILRVELSPQQSHCCKAILARNYEVLAKSTGTSKASLQNICMELKKACNHPLLLQSDFDIATLQANASLSAARRQEWHQALLYSSGKLALLDKLLVYLNEKRHRVLIFSQMVRMLNILSRYLTLRGYKHQRLDGTMSREVRKKAMDHFNSPDSDDFCFLLSTKAGGLGINLTTADTVIIYDSDWNPQNDLQAEARAHRIGQTKTVQIYRLVTKDTIEERILERAKTKMVLDTLVVQGLNKRTLSAAATQELNGSCIDPSDPGSIKASTDQVLKRANFGFSKEELTRILKFGACQLWKPTTPTPSGGSETPVSNGFLSTEISPNDDSVPLSNAVDLEKILAEAEEHSSCDTEGLADQLLSSFTNISDFRYEAPADPPEYDDKQFWDNAIPIAERQKYGQDAEIAALLLSGSKRHRKQVKRPGVILTESVDFLDDEMMVVPKKSQTLSAALVDGDSQAQSKRVAQKTAQHKLTGSQTVNKTSLSSRKEKSRTFSAPTTSRGKPKNAKPTSRRCGLPEKSTASLRESKSKVTTKPISKSSSKGRHKLDDTTRRGEEPRHVSSTRTRTANDAPSSFTRPIKQSRGVCQETNDDRGSRSNSPVSVVLNSATRRRTARHRLDSESLTVTAESSKTTAQQHSSAEQTKQEEPQSGRKTIKKSTETKHKTPQSPLLSTPLIQSRKRRTATAQRQGSVTLSSSSPSTSPPEPPRSPDSNRIPRRSTASRRTSEKTSSEKGDTVD